jgi:hypothetical protein
MGAPISYMRETMKQRTYKITAILTFPDGQLKGVLKVKATTPAQAETVARVQLATTWGTVKLVGIEIVTIK